MPKVLSTSVNADGGPHFEILTNAGFDIEAVDRGVDLFVEENLIGQMAGVSAISAGSEPYTSRVIESLPDLRVISRSGVGFDAVDLAELAITSDAALTTEAAPGDAFTLEDEPGVAVVATLAGGEKCARCWRVLDEVGAVAGSPDLCARCVDVVGPKRAAE